MKSRGKLILLLAAVGLAAAGCGGRATGGAPAAPELSGQDALDAQATLAVWSAQGTAVAASTAQAQQATAGAAAAIAQATREVGAAWATGTVVAAQATGEAAAQATGVAAATATSAAGYATATWDALVVQEKAISVQATADAGAYFMSATATADAAIVAFMQAEAAQAIAERDAANARRDMWTRLTPWLAGAVVVAATGLVFLVVGGYMAERVRRARPQQAGDMYVMWHPEGPRVIAPPRPALPRVEPRPQLPAGPPSAAAGDEPVALPAIRHGHALIAGETGSGKSTAMRAVLAARRDVVVLDPHSAGGDWGAAQVVGAGRDFDAIRDYMRQMSRMLSERYTERADGRQEFDAHTVAVDEMPAIVAAVGRDIETVWREWLREGRKVGLYLVLSTQSTRVRTLGIEGERDLLDNFGVVLVLGDLARQEYPALVDGLAHPAVLHTRGRARPVIIPQTAAPAVMAAPAAQPVAYATTEWPRREEPPIDPSNVDERAKQRIVDEFRRTLVFRQVQLALFPNYADDGGQAGKVIRRVLAEAGMIERDADGRWRPTIAAIGYEPSD